MPELDERGNNPTATESRRSNCRFLHRQQPRIVEKGPGICVGEIRKRLGPDTDLTVASMLWIGSCFLREIRSYYVCLLFEYKLMVTISKQKNFLGDTFACLKLHVTRPKTSKPQKSLSDDACTHHRESQQLQLRRLVAPVNLPSSCWLQWLRIRVAKVPSGECRWTSNGTDLSRFF